MYAEHPYVERRRGWYHQAKKLSDSGAADKATFQRVRVSPHQLPSTRSNPAQSRPTDNPVSDRRACIYKGSYVL